MGGLKSFAIAPAGGRHLHDPAGADPGLPDVLRRLFGPQRPGDVATVADAGCTSCATCSATCPRRARTWWPLPCRVS